MIRPVLVQVTSGTPEIESIDPRIGPAAIVSTWLVPAMETGVVVGVMTSMWERETMRIERTSAVVQSLDILG